jgi:hypothetical protein
MRMTRCGDDTGVGWITLRHNARQRDMHRRHFGPLTRRAVAVSQESVHRALGDLRAAPQLQSFQLWLVGSRVHPGHDGSDVDLVLSPGIGFKKDEQLIADALWYCRDYGLYGAEEACVIDPCFRSAGPQRDRVPLPPDAVVRTIKLLSPGLTKLVMQRRIQQWRQCGDIGLEFVRRAADTSYYAKLPQGDFAGARCRYLRPAVEICSSTADLVTSRIKETDRFRRRVVCRTTCPSIHPE